ncbi:tetratricopeptide repeat protein [Novosphingobium sp. KCTC 2891]|uniref:tetratricopeptide repeat protein n=1 Tax=Novosphingobium sp. KCTC 2891 TaxID=2989730 RepID=UPI0022233DB0|nr:tetratricopeptide repeat protein [Novosphingobium sp. KCTC 2891]MCW1382161.1 tetratricopeptide repeat protein [Novosphingobium sp. KCTC 2891]
MTEANTVPDREAPAGAGPGADAAATPRASGQGRAGKVLLGLAAVVALVAGGVAAFRGQKQEAVAVQPPAPVESQAPSVDNVIAKLETRLKENPEDAESWRMLGWSYFQTERYAEAATALKQATKLDPEHAETFSFLGEALVLASDTEGRIPPDARAAFDKALKLDPKDARARYFKAVAMDLAGQHRRAIDAWFALLADTPSDAPYADDIRKVIRDVGDKYKINVGKRLAEAQFAAPYGGMVTDGPRVAAAAIPGPSTDQMKAAAGLPKGQQEAMIRGMVDGLQAKLEKNPGNAEGWIMLMRSRMQLGEPARAAQALKDGLAAFRNDQQGARRLREAAASIGVAGA